MADLHAVEFTAMGGPGRIVAAGVPASSVREARSLVDHLERCWSRFRPDSGISQLNRHAGCVTLVSADTYALVDRAETARQLTGGRFNPLMLVQLRQLGYRDGWPPSAPAIEAASGDPACTESIDRFADLHAVRLPEGTEFDPGGIGKGMAVDRVAELLLDAGATTVSVELGGDLRVHGTCWYADRWRIPIAHPQRTAETIGTIEIDSGAVATSSTLGRAWVAGHERHHHLLDPTTGRPATSDLVAVTTCSTQAWWAEVLAKTALLSGTEGARTLLAAHGVSAVTVDLEGRVSDTTEVTV